MAAGQGMLASCRPSAPTTSTSQGRPGRPADTATSFPSGLRARPSTTAPLPAAAWSRRVVPLASTRVTTPLSTAARTPARSGPTTALARRFWATTRRSVPSALTCSSRPDRDTSMGPPPMLAL